ncbi:MAG: two-component system LytT family response regulator [Cyclobacteriaceae bacterium]|jgi:two-component system LytT family response regulator
MKKKFSCVVIEDDPAFLMMLGIAMRKLTDIEIIATFDKAFEAMSFLQNETPDILVTDINVQGHKGPELVSLCATHPQVIVISSHPETIMQEYSIAYTAYIQKPLSTLTQIKDAIDLCIKNLS